MSLGFHPASLVALASFIVGLVIPLSSRADLLYISNDTSNTIEKFTSGGTGLIFTTVLNFPTGLAFDESGNLYAANFHASSITKLTPSGTASLFTATSDVRGLALDSGGNLYAASEHSIAKYTAHGDAAPFSAGAGLISLAGLAFDSAGNLFAADYGGNTIFEYSPAGTRSVFATLSQPYGLAFDSAGNLFVAASSGLIAKFAPNGAGSAFAMVGVSSTPTGLAFDSAGDLYVADRLDNRIWRLSPNGSGSIFASTGLSGPEFLAFTDNRGVPLPLPIPEPTGMALLALGLPLLLTRRRPIRVD